MGPVFVVDDEAFVLELMELILRDAGFEVVAMGDGHAARAAFAVTRPRVLVTDVLMSPVDGVTLAREARSRWPGLPVVFVSGYTPEHLRVFRRENPDTAFLPKPFDVDQLVGAVRGLLAPA
ncbi:MAG: response regulator [Myxococcota bacterium]